MTMQTVKAETEASTLRLEATVNGSKTPVVAIRRKQGGPALDIRSLALFDAEKCNEYVTHVSEKYGLKAGEELALLLPPLADRVLATLSTPGADKAALQGQALQFPDPEPWPEPVELAAVLEELVALFHRFLSLPAGAAVAAALWVILTHCIRHTDVFPKLALLSPTKRCGKTTFLTLLGGVVCRALGTANVSPSVLFRIIEAYCPTMLLDEADQSLADQPEVIQILNASHARPTAFVLRNVGDDHEARRFSVYAPVAIACIGRLPSGPLEDRCIKVPMHRKPTGVVLDRLRLHELDGICGPIRQRITRWAEDHGERLRTADPAPLAQLHDRAQDNWRSLFGLADLAGGKWPDRARESALLLLGDGDHEDVKETLLADIHALFDTADRPEKLSSDAIVNALIKMEDRPYAEWGRARKPMTQVALAQVLRPFKIKPRMLRAGEDGFRGYHRADFEHVWLQYGVPPATPATSEERQQLTTFPTCNISQSCCGSEKPVTACESTFVAGVAGQNASPEEGVASEVLI